jgi:uncharacterized protein (DUF433 family)
MIKLNSLLVSKDGEGHILGKEHLKAEMVARMVVDGDYPIEDVMAHYGLTASEVHAALTYYYDNQPELDAAHERLLAEIQANATTLEKFKGKLKAKRSESNLSGNT